MRTRSEWLGQVHAAQDVDRHPQGDRGRSLSHAVHTDRVPVAGTPDLTGAGGGRGIGGAIKAKARPGACRTWSAESENRPHRGQFLPSSQAHTPAMGQEAGRKWFAAVDLQPAASKSGRRDRQSNHMSAGRTRVSTHQKPLSCVHSSGRCGLSAIALPLCRLTSSDRRSLPHSIGNIAVTTPQPCLTS